MAVYRIKHFDMKSGDSYSTGEFTDIKKALKDLKVERWLDKRVEKEYGDKWYSVLTIEEV